MSYFTKNINTQAIFGSSIILMKLAIELEIQEPVSERRDDQSLSTAEIFIHVCELDVSDWHRALVIVFIEVEPWLFEPFEVSRWLDVQAHLAKPHITTCDYVVLVDDILTLNNVWRTVYFNVIKLVQ